MAAAAAVSRPDSYGLGSNSTRCATLLWSYIAVEFYELLVIGRGWSLDRYADWIARAIITALT